MRRDMPGDLLLRPIPIFAAVLLILNDHVFKRRFGNVVTGKLSDLAGLVFVPLLCLALVEIFRAAIRADWRASAGTLAICVLGVAIVFISAKASPVIARRYGDVLGAARYPVRRTIDRVRITHDISDLIALPALAIA